MNYQMEKMSFTSLFHHKKPMATELIYKVKALTMLRQTTDNYRRRCCCSEATTFLASKTPTREQCNGGASFTMAVAAALLLQLYYTEGSF